jgi:pilus assembly protein CpaB
MPRRRGWILIFLGLVLAVGAGALVYVLLNRAAPIDTAQPTLPPTPVPTKRIPVANRLLEMGATISDTDITIREVPEDVPVVGVLTDTNEIVGQTVIEPIQQDEFFRPAQLRGGQAGQLSRQIAANRVVLAFPVADLLNQSKVIREGDHVDLLLTLDIQEESPAETRQGKSTNITLQNITVFRIVSSTAPTEENQSPPPQAILFEMTPQDAVIAKFIKDSGGTIDFTLRSPLDTGTFTTQMINQDYLFDNYGFRAPRSSSRPRQQ